MLVEPQEQLLLAGQLAGLCRNWGIQGIGRKVILVGQGLTAVLTTGSHHSWGSWGRGYKEMLGCSPVQPVSWPAGQLAGSSRNLDIQDTGHKVILVGQGQTAEQPADSHHSWGSRGRGCKEMLDC
jgi:hypothetical protein